MFIKETTLVMAVMILAVFSAAMFSLPTVPTPFSSGLPSLNLIDSRNPKTTAILEPVDAVNVFKFDDQILGTGEPTNESMTLNSLLLGCGIISLVRFAKGIKAD